MLYIQLIIEYFFRNTLTNIYIYIKLFNNMFLLNLLLFFILFPFRHPKLYFVFTIINAILSLFIYISLKPYYALKNGQDIHAKYPEFKRNDNLSFIRLFIGFMTLAWPRAILFLFTMWLESFVLLIGDVNNKGDSISRYK